MAEFESEDDRQYYLEKDPDHLSFVQEDILKVAACVQVVDFVPGEL